MSGIDGIKVVFNNNDCFNYNDCCHIRIWYIDNIPTLLIISWEELHVNIPIDIINSIEINPFMEEDYIKIYKVDAK